VEILISAMHFSC